MIKLDKSIHFNILTIFAIVFVCVYLYYTISDLKKIAVEVKKHSQDISNIVTNLATLNKDMTDIKKKCACLNGSGGSCQAPASTAKKTAAVLPKVTVTAVATAGSAATAATAGSAGSVNTTVNNAVFEENPTDTDLLNEIDAADAADAAADAADAAAADITDDADSVNTNEVKNLLSCIPGDDDDDDNDESAINDILGTAKSFKDMTIDELKQQSLEALKAYCKEHDLNIRGTKDALIQRIKA